MSDTLPTISWEQAQPYNQTSGGVPASATASGDPMAAIIAHIAKPISEEDIRRAMTPIAGPHVPTMPSNLMREIPAFQAAPLDNRQVVGAGNAKAQGIGNTFTAAANAIGSFIVAEKRAKQGKVRDAAQTVLTAQQAKDEAQQQLDMAMQSGDTATVSKMKDIIAQNDKAMQNVFSDKAVRKALSEGFHFNYVDPSENKTENHAAVLEALKNVKTAQEKKAALQALKQKQNATAAQNAIKAFSASQPQGLAPNTQAQAQLQARMAEQKAGEAAFKDYLNFKASMAHAQATVDAAKIRGMGAAILQQQRLGIQQDMMQQRFAQAEKLLGQRFNDSLKLVSARAAQARQLSKEIYADKQADPLAIYTKTMKTAESYQQNMLKDMSALAALQSIRASLYIDANKNPIPPEKVDQKTLQENTTQMELVRQAIQNDKANMDSFNNSAKQLHDMFGFSPVTGGGEGATGSESQSDAVGGTDDFTDPLNWMGNEDSGSGDGDQ